MTDLPDFRPKKIADAELPDFRPRRNGNSAAEAPITVNGPGFSVNFPAGTDRATINNVMAEAHAKHQSAAQQQGSANPFMDLPNASGNDPFADIPDETSSNPFMNLPDAPKSGADKAAVVLKESAVPAVKSAARGAANWALPLAGDAIPAGAVASEMIGRTADRYLPEWAAPIGKYLGETALTASSLPMGLLMGAAKLDDGDIEGNSLPEMFDSAKLNHIDSSDAAWEQHPMAYGVGATLGVGAGMLTGSGAAATGSRGVVAGLKTLGKASATGAAIGAGEGFSSGYGADERIDGAIMGGLAGGVLGGGGVALAKGLPALGRGVRNSWLSLTDGERLADEHFADALRDNRMDYIGSALDAERRGRDAPDIGFADNYDLEDGADDLMGMDFLGRRGQRLAKDAANLSGDVSARMRDELDQRQSGQRDRIANTINGTFENGLDDPDSIEQRLRQAYDGEVAAKYNTADANPNGAHIWTENLQRVLSTSHGQAALKDAITRSADDATLKGQEFAEPVFERGSDGLMQYRGMRNSAGDVDPNATGLSFRFWDSVKKTLDDIASVAFRAGDKSAGAGPSTSARMLRDEIDAVVPEYREARAGASAYFGAGDAMEAGRKYAGNIGSTATVQMRKGMRAMGPAERQMFQQSFASEMLAKLDRKGDGANLVRDFDTPASRKKIAEVLGDHAAGAIEAAIRREKIMRISRDALSRGSDTAANMLSNAALGAGLDYTMGTGTGYAGLAAAFAPQNLLKAATRGGLRFARGKQAEAYAQRMSQLLLERDPQVISDMLAKIGNDQRFLSFLKAAGEGMGK
jgi:hypothetical protein